MPKNLLFELPGSPVLVSKRVGMGVEEFRVTLLGIISGCEHNEHFEPGGNRAHLYGAKVQLGGSLELSGVLGAK